MLRPEEFERRDVSAQRVEFKPREPQARPSGENRESRTNNPSDRMDFVLGNSIRFGNLLPGRKKGEGKEESIQERSHSAEILSQAVKGEYQYAKLGLILGVLAIIGGTILGLHGAVGHTSWTAKVLGFESSINDAAPGVVLFVVGVFLVWITKPKIHLKEI